MVRQGSAKASSSVRFRSTPFLCRTQQAVGFFVIGQSGKADTSPPCLIFTACRTPRQTAARAVRDGRVQNQRRRARRDKNADAGKKTRFEFRAENGILGKLKRLRLTAKHSPPISGKTPKKQKRPPRKNRRAVPKIQTLRCGRKGESERESPRGRLLLRVCGIGRFRRRRKPP